MCIRSRANTTENKYQLINLDARSQSGHKPKATLSLSVNGKEQLTESMGDGIVDATFKAIEKLVKSESTLLLYSVNAVTQGTDSLGGVTVRLEKEGAIVNGSGSDTDIMIASVKAYLNALNLRDSGVLKAHPQKGI